MPDCHGATRAALRLMGLYHVSHVVSAEELIAPEARLAATYPVPGSYTGAVRVYANPTCCRAPTWRQPPR